MKTLRLSAFLAALCTLPALQAHAQDRVAEKAMFEKLKAAGVMDRLLTPENTRYGEAAKPSSVIYVPTAYYRAKGYQIAFAYRPVVGYHRAYANDARTAQSGQYATTTAVGAQISSYRSYTPVAQQPSRIPSIGNESKSGQR